LKSFLEISQGFFWEVFMEKKQFDPQKIAAFRFGVIGPLLSAPPDRGDLHGEIAAIIAKTWTCPVTGKPKKLGKRTVERWYYLAKQANNDPLNALVPKSRSDRGCSMVMTATLKQRLQEQYGQHKNWTYRLHADNLAALVRNDSNLGPTPSYSTIKRYMKATGMYRRRHWRPGQTTGQAKADERFVTREIRSFEVPHVGGMWHTDFHHCSIKVLTASGRKILPNALAIIDDHSRLICHIQWYFEETTEVAVHALMQAIQKRGLPRTFLSDNGGAFIASEFSQGLLQLGINHHTTLPYSPYQNGKQESFWNQVEGRLITMLEGVADLSLKTLNDATQAWVEREYNRAVHSEIGMSPLERFLEGENVLRPSPSPERLRQCFRQDIERTQRHSDGTVMLEGKRFEVPDQFHHLRKLTIRYARWDLRYIDIVDDRTGKEICPIYPLDKEANASGKRKQREQVLGQNSPQPLTNEMPPLLKELMQDYAASGLLPAYLPKKEEDDL
jgi:transposase InsO family protein